MPGEGIDYSALIHEAHRLDVRLFPDGGLDDALKKRGVFADYGFERRSGNE